MMISAEYKEIFKKEDDKEVTTSNEIEEKK